MRINIQPLEAPAAIPVESILLGGSTSVTKVPPMRGEYKQEECMFEKPWMRTAAYMYATGARPAKIAERLEVSESAVWKLSRQKWFRELVASIVHEEFSDDIGAMLKTCAVESLMIVRDIAANSSSDSVKLKAAQDMLDRHRGKATNFVQHVTGKVSEDPVAEMKRLQQEVLEDSKNTNVS